MHEKKLSGVDKWSKRLDDPERDSWQKPEEVLSIAGIAKGMVVADIGAGTGYFEPYLSRAVASDGRVFAIDIDQDLVTHMKTRFSEAALKNVEARLAKSDDPELQPQSVDRILVVDTWHHLDDPQAYAQVLHGSLAPRGQIAIVEYSADAIEGPPSEMRMDPKDIIKDLENAGFKAHLAPETLPRQFIVIGKLANT